MFNENDFSRLELSLPGCKSNFRYFRSRLKPSTKLLVLVKANAYGHGAVENSSALLLEIACEAGIFGWESRYVQTVKIQQAFL